MAVALLEWSVRAPWRWAVERDRAVEQLGQRGGGVCKTNSRQADAVAGSTVPRQAIETH